MIQENHPSLFHDKSTLFFGVGKFLAVFGDLLKEELLSILVFGNRRVAVLSHLHSEFRHVVERIHPEEGMQAKRFILFPGDRVLKKKRKVLSSPTMLKRQLLVALANLVRD